MLKESTAEYWIMYPARLEGGDLVGDFSKWAQPSLVSSVCWSDVVLCMFQVCGKNIESAEHGHI